MTDREFYARFYAVSFTELCKARKDLCRAECMEMALGETKDRYYSDLEQFVLKKDLESALYVISEYNEFLKKEGFADED